jgi:hypothetical protein
MIIGAGKEMPAEVNAGATGAAGVMVLVGPVFSSLGRFLVSDRHGSSYSRTSVCAIKLPPVSGSHLLIQALWPLPPSPDFIVERGQATRHALPACSNVELTPDVIRAHRRGHGYHSITMTQRFRSYGSRGVWAFPRAPPSMRPDGRGAFTAEGRLSWTTTDLSGLAAMPKCLVSQLLSLTPQRPMVSPIRLLIRLSGDSGRGRRTLSSSTTTVKKSKRL